MPDSMIELSSDNTTELELEILIKSEEQKLYSLIGVGELEFMWSNQTDMNRTGDVELTPPETEVKGYPPAVFISD